MFMSMRKSVLKASGVARKGVKSLGDILRFDSGYVSRSAGHSCRKDKKSYRPWRRNKVSITPMEYSELPAAQYCEVCGDEQILVSLEEGYSCVNARCPLHMETV